MNFALRNADATPMVAILALVAAVFLFVNQLHHSVNITPSLFACLSAEEIGRSVTIGRYAVALAVVITLILLILNSYRRDFCWLPLYGTLLAIHPAWSVSVYIGDCGYELRFLSVAISVVFVAALLCQLVQPRLPMRWFLLVLACTCWIAFGVSHLYWYVVDYTWLIGFLSNLFSPVAIDSFLFAASTLFGVAIVTSLVSALLYGFSWSRRPRRHLDTA